MKNRKAEPGLRLINMEDVAVEQVEWLLYPFIPYGKATIIQGDPGEGKTTMVLQIIAKLTKGEPVLPEKDGEEEPTEQTGTPVNVIYQTAEDGLEMFENIAYVMAKHADPSIPDTPEEWLDGFNTFSIYQVLPQIIEL